MPPAPSKQTILFAAGYGSIGIQTTRIEHGIWILANETSGRRHRAFYPWKRTSGSFEITIKHRSPEERRTFNDWLRLYCERICDPSNRTVGPLRIICQAVKFDRFCIPDMEGKPATFGRTFDETATTQDLGFIGASDPVQAVNAPLHTISAAYRSTYHTQGGKPGDYLSNYAIAALSEAVSAGGADVFEDALYNPKITPPPLDGGGWLPGQDSPRGVPLS